MGAEQSKRSKACWTCFAANGTQQCPSCNRYFHTECLTQSELAAKRTWICNVCEKLKLSTQIDKESDLKALPILINGLLQKGLFEVFENSLKSAQPSKAKAVRLLIETLESVKTNSNLATYTSFNAFHIDVNWILNQYVAIFSDDIDNQQVATMLKDVVADEIDGLRKCANCYANAHMYPENWFTMVCNEPHIIAWAKFQGCNFWPVKVMSVIGRKLSVRFFGDHTHADISTAKCYLFSEQSPAGKSGKMRGAQYKNALEEANVYIENIRKKFGGFIHAPFKSVIDPALLAEYTSQMVPSTNILRTIDPNSTSNDDDGAEVSSSSNIRGSGGGASACGSGGGASVSGNCSTNSSDATTIMDLSINCRNDNDSAASDALNVDEQPAKKARFASTAAAVECNALDQSNGDSIVNGQNTDDFMNQTMDITIADSHDNSDITPLSVSSDPMSDKQELDDLSLKYELLKQQNQMLMNENSDLKKRLEEKSNTANGIEQQRQQIDRTEAIEWAKSVKICCGCNTERPQDQFHFCDVRCKKRYLTQLKD